MPSRLPLIAALILAAGLSGGCSQNGNGTTETVSVEASPDDLPGFIPCTGPRPEMCTQQYAPVCGVHSDGTRRTYSNGCVACSDLEVVGSLPGACPGTGE
jgi:hypothetical protein